MNLQLSAFNTIFNIYGCKIDYMYRLSYKAGPTSYPGLAAI